MANWRQIKENFAVDQLIDLYIKVTKKTTVYQYIDGYGKAIKWDGWTLQPNTIAGKLFSWIDGTEFAQYGIEDKIDGIYLLFYGTGATNNHTYLIKLEPGMINWEYSKTQLDARRKSAMNFYEKWFDDLETTLVETYQEYDDAANDYVANLERKLLVGGVVVGGVWFGLFYWNNYGKYDLLIKKAAKAIREK